MAITPRQTRIVNTALIVFATAASSLAALLSYSRLPEFAVVAQIIVYCLAPAVVSVLFCASLALSFEAKANLLSTVLSVAVAILLTEFVLALIPVRHDPLEIARDSRIPPDTRSFLELMTDLWSAGERAYPYLAASKARKFRVLVEGYEMFSLSGGLANTETVFCNDTGKWQVYRSDKHGFNNDRGAWDEAPQIVLIGDSYAHGWCVDRDETVAAVLARRWPGTLNLGVSGSGPLTKLAVLREFAVDLAPQTVRGGPHRSDSYASKIRWNRGS